MTDATPEAIGRQVDLAFRLAETRRLNPPTVSARVADGRAADAQVSAHERYLDALADRRAER